MKRTVRNLCCVCRTPIGRSSRHFIAYDAGGHVHAHCWVGGIPTLHFRPAEMSRIELAAKIMGWHPDNSAIFARRLLLKCVAAILKPNFFGAKRRLRSRSSARNIRRSRTAAF
jgi:hypothetical protein